MSKSTEELQAQMKAIGGEWNSAYGYWELRLSDQRTMTFLYPDEAIELLRRFDQELKAARIDELQQLFDYLKETGGLCENDAYLVADRMQSRQATLNNQTKEEK